MNIAKYPSVLFPLTQNCLAESTPLDVKFSSKKSELKKIKKANW